LKMFNQITDGGFPRKTINIITAAPGVGKTMLMCHIAASVQRQGFNVLYITLEMASEMIAQRIDANMMDTKVVDLRKLSKSSFDSKIEHIKSNYKGRLIVKEYPTASANSNHIRALLEELKIKRKFVPDMIVVDYLGLCTSSRIKRGNGVNSFDYLKSIAEELRGLGTEYDAVILTASQFNRDGAASSDPSMMNTSESFGLPFTADLQIAIITDEAMLSNGKMLFKQFKNRYRDYLLDNKFCIGVDREKMKFYDLPDLPSSIFNVEDEDGEKEKKPTESRFNKPPLRTAGKTAKNSVDDWKF
jgi:replicative DNA helicase